MRHARLFSIALISSVCVFLGGVPAEGHWPHGRVHRAIIDPLVTHHAVLEDELRVNWTYEQDPEDGNTHWVQEWEAAWAFRDTVGVELFAPVEWFDPLDGETTAGLGDMGLALKPYSYVGPEGRLVVTPQLNVTLPTGDPERKLGKAVTVWKPSLFVDKVLGEHVALQSNLEIHLSTDRPEVEHHVEYSTSLAYSFYAGNWTLSPLVEFNGETFVSGARRGEDFLTLVPGVKVALRGWHVGLGVQWPVSGRREYDGRLLVQAGYHFSW